MTRLYLTSFMTLFLFMASGQLSAAIYKWKNEDGQIHYGSMPPKGIEFQKMGVSTKFTPPPVKTKKVDAAKATADSKADGADGAKKDPYTKQQHTELCNNAKKDLATLSKGSRLRVKQEDGSTNVMNEKDKSARMKTMQGIMKKHCI